MATYCLPMDVLFGTTYREKLAEKWTRAMITSLFCLGLADYSDCENCTSKKHEDETEGFETTLKSRTALQKSFVKSQNLW